MNSLNVEKNGSSRATRRMLVGLALLAPLAMGTRECEIVVVGDDDGENCDAAGSCMEPDPGTCTYEGQEYSEGADFPSSDGCNTCTCTPDGVACTDIGCAPACGGIAGVTCGDGEYCNFGASCGSGDQTGTCELLPDACDLNYAPVCGCDGMTYGNACAAAVAGVSVARDGECGGGQPCGGWNPVTCPEGQYCLFSPEAACGVVDAPGSCTPLPADCESADPVCSCGNETFDNACKAAMAGVPVAHLGACGGQACGGWNPEPCPEGQYCMYPAAASCGATDGAGTCALKPEACDAIYDPVCGCDGVTYDNDCSAAVAGVSVAATGECASGGGCMYNAAPHQVGDMFPAPDGCNTCTCLADGSIACTDKACVNPCGPEGTTCLATEYCAYPQGTQCGMITGDAPSCEPRPDTCLAIVEPVTGCDGKTYPSACDAAAAGVSPNW